MKLYKVTLEGMTFSTVGQTVNGIGYVVAENTEIAYQTVKDFLDRKDFGFLHERNLDTIELLAETGDYPNSKHRLYLS